MLRNKEVLKVYHVLVLILIMACVLSYGIHAKATLLNLELINAIEKASEEYNIEPKKLLKIAFVESSLNVNVKPRYNTNGTQDIGPFQINTIHWHNTCSSYDLESLEGNTMCAAKLIRKHSRMKHRDKQWLARYHSKTPRFKRAYHAKLVKAEKYLKSKKILKFYLAYTDDISRQVSEI